MKPQLERLRAFWEDLNDRERTLVGALGILLGAFLLGFPLFWTARQNSEIEERNESLREVLKLIDAHRPQLVMLNEVRKAASARYRNKTPPLGSFLETEAKKFGLTIREVTDQPEKSSGSFTRRSVTASVDEVDLTGIMNMLSDIVNSRYPVAIDHIQIEHYQSGDKYRFKLGVLTFDRNRASAKPKNDGSASEEG